MRVTELQQACERQGLEYDGLNKRGLIRALETNARQQEEAEEISSQPDENEQDDVASVQHAVDGTGNGGSFDGAPMARGSRQLESADSGEASLLELKLALAREENERIRAEQQSAESAWRIERERRELGIGPSTQGSMTQTSVTNNVTRILPRMVEGEPLIYFSAFERTLTLNGVSQTQWSKLLGSTLTLKAQKALSALSISQLEDYSTCKRAILDYYKLDACAYLQKFRAAKREGDETYKMFRTRLSDYLAYYLNARNITTYSALFDDVLLQQLQSSFPQDTQNFVLTREPRSLEEAANFADLRSRMTGSGVGNTTQNSGGAAPPPPKKQNGNHHPQTHQQSLGGKATAPNMTQNKRFACYICGSPEHKRANCPMENRTISSTRPCYSVCSLCGAYHPVGVPCYGRNHPAVYAAASYEINDDDMSVDCIVRSPFLLPICINSKRTMAVRDTGNMAHTIVAPHLVGENDYIGESVKCKGIFGGVAYNVPLAKVRIFAPALGCNCEVHVVVGVHDFGGGGTMWIV